MSITFFKWGLSNQPHPVFIPLALFIPIMFSYPLLKWNHLSLVLKTFSVVPQLCDFAHIICPSYPFLCNKLLSRFLYYKMAIWFFSGLCRSEIWKGFIGQFVSNLHGTAEAGQHTSEGPCLAPWSYSASLSASLFLCLCLSTWLLIILIQDGPTGLGYSQQCGLKAVRLFTL